jgi:hypothetical protein
MSAAHLCQLQIALAGRWVANAPVAQFTRLARSVSRPHQARNHEPPDSFPERAPLLLREPFQGVVPANPGFTVYILAAGHRTQNLPAIQGRHT